MNTRITFIISSIIWLSVACSSENKVQDPVLGHYYTLKDALVDTNAETAAAAAVTLANEAKSTPGMEEVAAHATTIAGTDDVEAQRVTFELLSMALYDAISAGNPYGETVYVQFCPMAFDDKGAFWLSSNEEIFNPYFGDKMLKCGVVKETISIQ